MMMMMMMMMMMIVEYKVDPTDLHLSGLESFSFDYMVKWPVSLVLNRKVWYSLLYWVE